MFHPCLCSRVLTFFTQVKALQVELTKVQAQLDAALAELTAANKDRAEREDRAKKIAKNEVSKDLQAKIELLQDTAEAEMTKAKVHATSTLLYYRSRIVQTAHRAELAALKLEVTAAKLAKEDALELLAAANMEVTHLRKKRARPEIDREEDDLRGTRGTRRHTLFAILTKFTGSPPPPARPPRSEGTDGNSPSKQPTMSSFAPPSFTPAPPPPRLCEFCKVVTRTTVTTPASCDTCGLRRAV